MGFGFPPKHSQDIYYNNLDRIRFIAIAKQAVQHIGWKIVNINESEITANTKISMSSWGEEIRIELGDESAKVHSLCYSNQIYDWGKNKKNVEKFIEMYEDVKHEISTEELESILTATTEELVTENEGSNRQSAIDNQNNHSNFFSIFRPSAGYVITPILIIINILVFIFMTASGTHIMNPDGESLLNWGANFRPLIIEGEWWRLFTACFVHIGILHLLMNMYALLYIGHILEPILGKVRFLAAYIITGIAASVASVWWHDFTISAGASGAIFGMYGVFLLLLSTNILDKSVRKTLLTSIGIFVAYNLLNGLKSDSGVDNAAHIAGLLSGAVVGLVFIPGLRNNNSLNKVLSIGTLSVVLLAASFFTIKNLPDDIVKYDETMKQFAEKESLAMHVFTMFENSSDEDILNEFKERGFYYWNENLALIESFDKQNLPVVLKERNAKLKKYCKLRIKSYELMYKSIEANTNQYDTEIMDCNLQIEQIINELSGK